jgi:hypothetical protein
MRVRAFCLYREHRNIKTYETNILTLFFNGCETWFLILRKEHKLRVFENRVLRTVFGT